MEVLQTLGMCGSVPSLDLHRENVLFKTQMLALIAEYFRRCNLVLIASLSLQETSLFIVALKDLLE